MTTEDDRAHELEAVYLKGFVEGKEAGRKAERAEVLREVEIIEAQIAKGDFNAAGFIVRSFKQKLSSTPAESGANEDGRGE